MNGVYNGAGGHDPALYSWQEVTRPFLDSCQQLQLGELLHDDMFGLFEVRTQEKQSQWRIQDFFQRGEGVLDASSPVWRSIFDRLRVFFFTCSDSGSGSNKKKAFKFQLL